MLTLCFSSKLNDVASLSLLRYVAASLLRPFLRPFVPRSEVMLLLRRQHIELMPHRLQLEPRNLAIEMFRHNINLRLHCLVILHQILRHSDWFAKLMSITEAGW